jgi:hypothetical protein
MGKKYCEVLQRECVATIKCFKENYLQNYSCGGCCKQYIESLPDIKIVENDMACRKCPKALECESTHCPKRFKIVKLKVK